MVKLIQLLGEAYIMEILEALEESPKRFTDLDKACPSEKTRIRKLRSLRGAGLIETTTKKMGKRDFVHYKLTAEGKMALERAKEIDK